ncbi:Os10g0100200, partial [Oryza sativa Japonica Group]
GARGGALLWQVKTVPAPPLAAACHSIILWPPCRRSRRPPLATARRLRSPQPLPRLRPPRHSLQPVTSQPDDGVEVGEGRQGGVKGVVALAR